METLTAIGNWISESESVLSGAAAIIVLLGVVASMFGFVRHHRTLATKRRLSNGH